MRFLFLFLVVSRVLSASLSTPIEGGGPNCACSFESVTSPLVLSDGVVSMPAATSSANGYLTLQNWTIFNSKQQAGDYITALTGDVTAAGPGSTAATISNTTVTSKVLTGFSAAAGTVSSGDTILSAINKIVANIALRATSASPVFTGSVTFGNYKMSPSEYDAGNSGAAKTIDFSAGSAQKLTLTASTTLTFTNPQAGAAYVIKLVQDSNGLRTVTFPGSVLWSGGTPPTLTTTPSKKDLINFYYDGTSYYGSFSLNY